MHRYSWTVVQTSTEDFDEQPTTEHVIPMAVHRDSLVTRLTEALCTSGMVIALVTLVVAAVATMGGK